MTKIIGFSGKKGSGKNACANFVIGHCLASMGFVQGGFSITPEGKLYVSDIFGETSNEGIFDISRRTSAFVNFREKYLDKFFKVYSFADLLKNSVCIDILGLKESSVYGSDEEKNELTHIRWENMPGVFITDEEEQQGQSIDGRYFHKGGPMSGREVMQYMGTEVFRKIMPRVWCDATIRRIYKDAPEIALITDVRFPDEAMCIVENDGSIVRLMRSTYNDNHYSECALDRHCFNYEYFTLVLPEDITIKDQNDAIYDMIIQLDLFAKEE